MATTKQVAANRRNAQHSSGPKTEGGKSVSCFNALKHGLLAQHALLSDEDRGTFAEFSMEFHVKLDPQGPLEGLLVDRVVTSAWRLRRVIQVETCLFDDLREERDHTGFLAKEKGLGHAFIAGGYQSDCFSKLTRYETTLERAMFRALHELQRVQAERHGMPFLPPVAVDLDVNVLEALEHSSEDPQG